MILIYGILTIVYKNQVIMKKLIISIVILFASMVFAYAQKAYDGCADVKGISRETKCDYAKFVSVFGVPERYKKVGEPKDGETYFVFQNNGELTSFALKDSRFPALTNYIEGGIRVGDRISKLDKFEYGKPVFKKTLEDGTAIYRLWEDSYDRITFSVKNGIIELIVYISVP